MKQNSIHLASSDHSLRQSTDPAHVEAEETLRLLARLEPPVGVADRVHYRLRHAQSEMKLQGSEKQSFWAFWMPVRRLKYAGAALLAIAVAGSTWGMYHHSMLPVKGPMQGIPSGNFGSAGAERHPNTLTPIKVPAVPKKKPRASRVKPVGRTSAVSPMTSPAKSETTPTSPNQ